MATVKQILEDGGVLNTHWGERIVAAEKRGGFTDRDKYDSNEWVTCACGRATADVPRYSLGIPKDRALQSDGEKFRLHVWRNWVPAAALTLVRIEKRAKAYDRANPP